MTLVPQHIILQSPASNDPLLDLNTQPSLDLQFATGKTLDDRVSGLPLVNHQRDASSGKSAGTYVGSDGLIKTSPVNLKTYSNDFTQQWQRLSSSILSTNNPDPFGGLAAARIDLSVANSRLQINGTSARGISTFSVWMKLVSGNDQVRLLLQTSSGANTGDTVTVTSEWQRFSTTQNVSSGGGIQIRNPTSTPVVVEVYGAQLQEGSTASTYVPTTNLQSGEPRFDHAPVTGESLGLLIEESRTNELARSEEFDSTYYIKAFATVTPDQSTAPDGNTTADQVLPSTNASYHRMSKSGISVSAPCVLSLFVKANGYNHFQLRTRGSSNRATVFDVSNGTITQEMETSIGETNLGNGLTPVDYGNGWWRLSMVRTDTDTITTVDLSVLDTGTPGSQTYGFIGDGTSSVFCWGAMLEQGSFQTSYIPTSGSTVTRAADVASITGTNFSSWYNQSEGTVFADFQTYGTSTQQIIALTAGASNSTRWGIWNNQLYIAQSGSQYFSSLTPSTSPTKTAFAVANNDAIGASNGSLTAQDTTVILPTPDNASIGRTASSQDPLNGHIKRLTYYPYRLADATLQEITS